MKSLENKVSWVGTGPGDPEMISIKGIRTIKQANAILYDRWIPLELLEYAQPFCKTVQLDTSNDVRSSEVKELLVYHASRFSNVVRLTSGDPNVYGRGYEEMEYVRRHGFCVENIPGITSATAAPAAAGIPLTLRGVNESFCVINGTDASGEIAEDVDLVARSSSTIIILMGASRLKEIARVIASLRGAAEPMAVISNATTPEQTVVTGIASDITERAQSAAIVGPAVIVAGKVVSQARLERCIEAHKPQISRHSLALPFKDAAYDTERSF